MFWSPHQVYLKNFRIEAKAIFLYFSLFFLVYFCGGGFSCLHILPSVILVVKMG
jgi:hypothetical protein